ncbi:MAG: aminopeptidase P family protein [Paracoccaceae bacterium]
MFQTFTSSAAPEQGPPRLADLRGAMVAAGLDGFLIPRADVHQGEYVAPCDDRLAWLTGFTGSAGFCAALRDKAGVFIDGRYRTQVKAQVDPAHFAPVPWPEVKLAGWLASELGAGVVGYDPLLHTAEQIAELTAALPASITLRACANQVDTIWHDRPAPPQGAITPYPELLAGESHAAKRTRIAATLRKAGQQSAVLTLPDSIAWLLNIRGTDIARNPVPHCFAVLHDDARLTLYVDPAKLDGAARAHLGTDITLRPPNAFGAGLRSLTGPVRVDHGSAPIWVVQELNDAGVPHVAGQDPCVLPKACKSPAEITATREAHLRDGAAMVRFLHWFDQQPAGSITEIDVVTALEGFRADTNQLRDISFETIAGTGANGAVIHYRVTESTNARLEDGQLIVVDSGGQYLDGTTDITRTLPVGSVGAAEKQAFTRVLQGMIAISRARFPHGVAGQHLDALARAPLWMAGQDYDHGTGHGVGVFLCVHEGPQRISRLSDIALRPGMILSNEPGYYREGAFGIRIENLIAVQDAPALPDGDAHRAMLDFETLTFAPIDRRLIDTRMLSGDELAWLNAYHAACRDKIGTRISGAARVWLEQATQPL